MEKAIVDYVNKTGALTAELVTTTEEYGDVWEFVYGFAGDDGIIEPTGLPVFGYVSDGEVAILPPDESFRIIESLGRD